MAKTPKTAEQLDDSFYRALRKQIRGKSVPAGRLDELADAIVAAGGKAKEGFGRKAAQQKVLDKSARAMGIDQLAEEFGQALGRAKDSHSGAGVYDKVKDFANSAANKIRGLDFDIMGTDSLGPLKKYQGQQDELVRMANAMSGRTANVGPLFKPEDIAKSAKGTADYMRGGKNILWNQRGAVTPEMLGAMGGMGASVGLGIADPISPEIAEAPGGNEMRFLEQQQGMLGGPVPSSKDIDAMILEQSMTGSPAPEKEYYGAIEPEMGGMPMIQKSSKSSTMSKKTKSKPKVSAVEEVTEEYFPQEQPRAGSAPRGYQSAGGMDAFMSSPVNAEINIDPETLIEEMTRQKAPNAPGYYRGQLPKRMKQGKGMRETWE